jgi:hypothetical protein
MLAALQAAPPGPDRNSPIPFQSTRPAPPATAQQARVLEQFGQLPLYFEPNLGQADAQVQFVARAAGYTMLLMPGEAVMALGGRTENALVRMKMEGAGGAAPVGLERQTGISAYFIGNDPKQWRPGVPHYARVKYADVYPGVDLLYYGDQRQVEYDFIVAPGANPSRIRLAYEGVDGLRVDGSGDLVLSTRLGELKQRKPRVYQDIGGRRVEVAATYRLQGRRVGVEIAAYDHRRPLAIDPVLVSTPSLVYSTHFGSGASWPVGIAADAAGATYIAGWSVSIPTLNAYQATPTGGSDVFVAKFNPCNGTGAVTLAYSTYLGSTATAVATGIAVDANGGAYVAARVDSSTYYPITYPTTASLGPTGGVNYTEAYVTKLNAYGGSGTVTLGYSTRIGGTVGSRAGGIAVDSNGSAYLTGTTSSTDFPVVNAAQPAIGGAPACLPSSCASDAFVAKLTPGGNALAYSTYLGGSLGEDHYDGNAWIAVDSAGAAYVTGTTDSFDFPVVQALQAQMGSGHSGWVDSVFATKLSPNGSKIVYSTYLTTQNVSVYWSQVIPPEGAGGIAVDSSGAAYVAGGTLYTDFPTVNAYQPYFPSLDPLDYAAFVTKLNPNDGTQLLTLGYSTYFVEGSGTGTPLIAADASGAVYVAGSTLSKSFPLLNAWQLSLANGDGYLAKFNPNDGRSILTLAYSTLFGGNNLEYLTAIATDVNGAVYLTGRTLSADFPTANAFQESYGFGFNEAFVLKFAPPAQ